jgi:hypothetical protein
MGALAATGYFMIVVKLGARGPELGAASLDHVTGGR